ncbi:hypothetical protein F5Y04DRAFT_281067 [Hypomontagnella monticulosa]|nr:hypothetical protein F5Y04DRAFT_281067 [Hypomontagnella monticulosa]
MTTDASEGCSVDGPLNDNLNPELGRLEGKSASPIVTTNASGAPGVSTSDVRADGVVNGPTEDPHDTVLAIRNNSSDSQIPMQETTTATTVIQNDDSITLVHDNDMKFMIPRTIWKTWKSMEDFLLLSYENDEDAKKEIDNGDYKIFVEEKLIFRSIWEDLVRPGWTVDIRRNSQAHLHQDSASDTDESISDEESDLNENDTPDENSDMFAGKYEVKAKYTVAYYETRYGDDQLVHSTSRNDAIVLRTSGRRSRELCILEETTSVKCATQGRRWPDKSDDAPMLRDGDRIGDKYLNIHSPLLINAFRAVVKYSVDGPSGDDADEQKVEKHSYPYRELYYHRQELLDYKNQTDGIRANHTKAYNAECNKHIDALLDYLENEPTIQIKALEARWAKKVPTTTFAGFWLLMKPGSDVYVWENGQLNAYVVDTVSGGVQHFFTSQWSNNVRGYTIRVWNLIYDGKVIKRWSKNVFVPVFDNERNITSLPVFPTKFWDILDDEKRRKELIKRGRNMFEFAKGPAFLEYTGSGLRPGLKKYNRARVVVQHESQPWTTEDVRNALPDRGLGYDMNASEIRERPRVPHCECRNCNQSNAGKETYASVIFGDYDDINPKRQQTTLSEHQALLCMSHMYGFILKDRVYDLLDISGLTSPRIAKDAIDQLVMRPESNKETIKAIVRTYTDANDQSEHFSADLIRGKGEGQVFLLHGPPGTGKTLTAESVAEYTKRPLLSITAADLGHDPVELERNLLRFFKDANNWDAIVLLDEADVYLERRSPNDLRRNSIVSIFLRALDYFQGILFLTTNRVGLFDEAFLSRIHVSIGYESLNDAARGKIWDNLFKKIKEDHKHGGLEIRYDYDAKQYVKKSEEIKKLEWNGREIRNAFQSAVALAIYDSKMAREKGASIEDSVPEVKESHLQQIATMSTAFKNYMVSTHEGVGNSDLAYKTGIRNDKFNASSTTEAKAEPNSVAWRE